MKVGMNRRILQALDAIRSGYGDGVFYNVSIVRNLLNDLAPQLKKERIQVGNFLDIGGYFQLKYAAKEYAVVRTRLRGTMIDTFAVDAAVADWILDIFSEFLGYEVHADGAVFAKESPAAPVKREVMVVPRPAFHHAKADAPQQSAFTNWHVTRRIAADSHSVAVTRGGIVRACGPRMDGQCSTSTYDWRQIVAVSAGVRYTVGLSAVGTCVATGNDDYGQLQVKNWRDITAISAGARHTVGLMADGTPTATGHNKNGECNITHWTNCVHIVAGQDCTFAVKKDGRVLVAGDNKNGDLQVSHLENIADIGYGAPGRIIALTKDGRIARVGRENHMRKSFAKWRDVKQISAAPNYFAGLFDDGTVRLLAHFWTDNGSEAACTDWRDIVAIAAGKYHILGLRSDGKIQAAMLHPDPTRNKGQLNIQDWEVQV